MSRQIKKYEKGLQSYKTMDYKRAHDLLIKFAERGDSEAQVVIGTIYQLGLGGLPIDEDRAIKWYLSASAQGNGVASNNLGTLASLKGDRDSATKWYNLARTQGFRHSPSPDSDEDIP